MTFEYSVFTYSHITILPCIMFVSKFHIVKIWCRKRNANENIIIYKFTFSHVNSTLKNPKLKFKKDCLCTLKSLMSSELQNIAKKKPYGEINKKWNPFQNVVHFRWWAQLAPYTKMAENPWFHGQKHHILNFLNEIFQVKNPQMKLCQKDCENGGYFFMLILLTSEGYIGRIGISQKSIQEFVILMEA